MKIVILIQAWCGALALAGCSTPDASLATLESPEIGVCGANADPTTGVICRHTYSATGGETFVSAVVFEQNTLDYVRCTWSAPCDAPSQPCSPNGAACLSTIGTGCSSATGTGMIVKEVQLSPGTPASGAAAVCGRVIVYTSDLAAACSALNGQTEQYEDLCCLPRVPPPPPPADAGVGAADAGTATSADAVIESTGV